MLDTAGKTFDRVLNQRLLEVCHPEPEQYGFVRGRSTEGALVAITDCITSAASKYQLALFVVISGAFDNLWWPSLFEELRRRGTPTYLYCLLRDYCRDREVTLTTPGGSVLKRITKGCPQGSVLGPTLWNIMMDTAIKRLRPHSRGIVAYADDLTIILAGDSRRELEAKGLHVANALQEWGESTKLKVSAAKSAAMVFGGRLQRPPTLRICGDAVPVFAQHRNLGVVLDRGLSFQAHLTTACDKALKMIYRIASLAKRQFGIRPLPPCTLSTPGCFWGYYATLVVHGHTDSYRIHARPAK